MVSKGVLLRVLQPWAELWVFLQHPSACKSPRDSPKHTGTPRPPPAPLESALAGKVLEVAAPHAPIPSHLPDLSCQKLALLPKNTRVKFLLFCLVPSLFSSSPATHLLWA